VRAGEGAHERRGGRRAVRVARGDGASGLTRGVARRSGSCPQIAQIEKGKGHEEILTANTDGDGVRLCPRPALLAVRGGVCTPLVGWDGSAFRFGPGTGAMGMPVAGNDARVGAFGSGEGPDVRRSIPSRHWPVSWGRTTSGTPVVRW